MLPATRTREGAGSMDENPLYEMARVVGTSRTSVSEAIAHAVEQAAERGRDVRWFEVKELRGWVEGGTIQHHQAVVLIGFLAPPGEAAEAKQT